MDVRDSLVAAQLVLFVRERLDRLCVGVRQGRRESRRLGATTMVIMRELRWSSSLDPPKVDMISSSDTVAAGWLALYC